MAQPPDDHRDELPAELDVTGYVGPYTFPDVKRRRIAAVLYAVTGAAGIAAWAARGTGVLVNEGVLWGGVGLVLVGAYHVAAGWPLKVDEHEALVAATRRVGFPVGHASAQLGWQGLRSRPLWRILLYSAENPPEQRGMVLVDGVDGEVVADYVERNPEDWSELDR